MIAVALKESQVFYSVVATIVIDVMDMFIVAQHAPQVIRHNEAMLQHVSGSAGHGVLSSDFDTEVLTRSGHSPALPARTARPRELRQKQRTTLSSAERMSGFLQLVGFSPQRRTAGFTPYRYSRTWPSHKGNSITVFHWLQGKTDDLLRVYQRGTDGCLVTIHK